jgi:hypothetical protein
VRAYLPGKKDHGSDQKRRVSQEARMGAPRAAPNSAAPTPFRLIPAANINTNTADVACLYFTDVTGLFGKVFFATKHLKPGIRSQWPTKKAGRSGGGFERPGWRSSPGEEKLLSADYNDEGLFCPVVAGVVAGWVVSPTVFVISRTSTRRLSARPALVLLVSTGLSLPSPMT